VEEGPCAHRLRRLCSSFLLAVGRRFEIRLLAPFAKQYLETFAEVILAELEVLQNFLEVAFDANEADFCFGAKTLFHFPVRSPLVLKTTITNRYLSICQISLHSSQIILSYLKALPWSSFKFLLHASLSTRTRTLHLPLHHKWYSWLRMAVVPRGPSSLC
jgi:hypothetical protein